MKIKTRHFIQHLNVAADAGMVILPQPMFADGLVVIHDGVVLSYSGIEDPLLTFIASDRNTKHTPIYTGICLEDKTVETVQVQGHALSPSLDGVNQTVTGERIHATINSLKTLLKPCTTSKLASIESIILRQMEFDPSGSLVENYVTETHKFEHPRAIGIIKPLHGIFFNHTAHVRCGNATLTLNKDYVMLPVSMEYNVRGCGLRHTLYDMIRIVKPTEDLYTVKLQFLGGIDQQAQIDALYGALGVLAKKVTELDQALSHR